MIKLEDYVKYLGWVVKVTLVNDQICDEGTTIEGVFSGYDFAVCSGEEEDNLAISMGGGWIYGLNVSDIKGITPLYKLDRKAYKDMLTRECRDEAPDNTGVRPTPRTQDQDSHDRGLKS
ncbi:hypothetical protein [Helicobacter suis]|uniref:hypothetical protein n=1 Tax=Helicobacter suis TaxID=104628 RepID=UPI0013D76C98|nr:hypothetical protein [Helicobacter suis]